MPETEARNGTLYAISAYLMWGFAPLYFKAIASVAPDEILMHRVIWSFFLVIALVWFGGRMGEVRALLRQPKKVALLALTAVLVGANWLIFIWAVANDHVLDASLGYFINPLFSVALGMLVLGERLGRLQMLAVGIATLGVLVQLIQFGSVPWISLALAGSFGIYGLLRKQVNLQASTGLLVETAILLPLALAYWAWIDSPTANFANNPLSLNLLLLAAGVVTTLPLLAFSAAAIRIPLYLLGMLQYIGPSIMFVMALTLFGESLSGPQLLTFGFIWSALVLLSFDGIKKARRKRRALKHAV
ncbi:EamA family transporter RarD [Ferrimonas balearica]|uniref:EamA family transporter RarD n=1 Tax=Ferrimonas balearica TaxID=44012 RepID=UPI001F1FC437|nr:EamA family transporter RarD [Ferrimonas balearica]MBY6019565.1 EamA family transporter RarD [Halomonas denitrificans]MBY6096631.1 EamA family transporter RarD [Ferrimonas balearica]